MIASFWHNWVWPAGGSGGTVGDVVGSIEFAVLAAIVTVLIWPRVRHAVERFVKRHLAAELADVRRRLDHIIEHHPDIPDLPEQASDQGG